MIDHADALGSVVSCFWCFTSQSGACMLRCCNDACPSQIMSTSEAINILKRTSTLPS